MASVRRRIAMKKAAHDARLFRSVFSSTD